MFFNFKNTKEKIDLLFMDVETEGKKRGYEKAAKEYRIAYLSVEKEFKEAKELIDNQKNKYGNQAYQYIERLEQLEIRKELLQKQIDSKIKEASIKYKIPIEEINRHMCAGTLLGPLIFISPLDILCSLKEKKLLQAEQRGYEEAKKEIFEPKIRFLKEELVRLKQKGNNEINTLINQISDIINEIAKKELEIAELKLLLQEY